MSEKMGIEKVIGSQEKAGLFGTQKKQERIIRSCLSLEKTISGHFFCRLQQIIRCRTSRTSSHGIRGL